MRKAVVKVKRFVSRMLKASRVDDIFPGVRLPSGEDPLTELATLLKHKNKGALFVPFRQSTSVHDFRQLAAQWPGDIVIEVAVSDVCERVSFLRKDGFGIKVLFPHVPGALPGLGVNGAGLHLLKDMRYFSGSGTVEFAIEVDHKVFWLLPRFVFLAGRYKPSVISVMRLSNHVDEATFESAKVASLEAKGMGFSLRVAGLGGGDW